MLRFEPGTFQPLTRQPDFGRNLAVKEVPGSFDFQGARVHSVLHFFWVIGSMMLDQFSPAAVSAVLSDESFSRQWIA
jgi:hypothetical protein